MRTRDESVFINIVTFISNYNQRVEMLAPHIVCIQFSAGHSADNVLYESLFAKCLQYIIISIKNT